MSDFSALPPSGIATGLPAALLAIVSIAFAGAEVPTGPGRMPGVNVTSTLHAAPGASVVQVVDAANCGSLAAIDPKVTGLAPTFTTRTERAGDVVPIDCPPNEPPFGTETSRRRGCAVVA